MTGRVAFTGRAGPRPLDASDRSPPRTDATPAPRALVRLDLLHPRAAENPGTNAPPAGVVPGVGPAPGAAAPPRREARPATLVLVLALAVGLLGQGERFDLDARLRSPSSTLLTYWGALAEGDTESVFECLSELRDDQPLPGTLWFLPPTDELWLEGFRSLPVTGGRVLVTYEVHYRPTGAGEERMFQTGSELVRERGEWRIARPIGEASMPEWKPVPGPVDT